MADVAVLARPGREGRSLGCRRLHVPLAVLPLALAPVLQAYAIGLAMGGLVMVYKRLEALYQVGSLVLVALIAAPETASPVVRYLPFNLAVRLLYRVMSEGRALVTLPAADLTFVLVQTGLLLGMGWAVYARAEGVARREGLIGQY